MNASITMSFDEFDEMQKTIREQKDQIELIERAVFDFSQKRFTSIAGLLTWHGELIRNRHAESLRRAVEKGEI